MEDMMELGTQTLSHLALRVTDPERSRHFYHEQLGLPILLETPQVTLLGMGQVALALLGADAETSAGDRFDPHRIGLDHVALGVNADKIPSLLAQLNAADVPNNGIQHDDLTGAQYIAFYDPDGIAWELYAMPAGA